MGKAEILKEMAHLSPQDLAEVRERVEQLARGKAIPQGQVAPGGPAVARIPRPHLANPSQSHDFFKQVCELSARARL